MLLDGSWILISKMVDSHVLVFMTIVDLDLASKRIQEVPILTFTTQVMVKLVGGGQIRTKPRFQSLSKIRNP